MRVTKKLRTLFVLGTFVISAILLTGCFGPEKAEMHDSEISAEGVVLEDYLPQDTLLFLTINTLDKDQKENLMNLISYFPQKDTQDLIQSLVEEVSGELDKADVTLEGDILPIFSSNFRMIVGIAGDMTEDEPDVYVAFTVGDTEKAKALMEKIAETDSKMTKTEIRGQLTLENDSDDVHIILYKDTILITMMKLSDDALDRQMNNKASVRSNEKFSANMKNLPSPNIGTLYMDIENFFRQAQELETKRDTKYKNADLSEELIDMLSTEAFAFVAKEDGLEMLVQVAFNPDSESNLLGSIPYEMPYMYKEIPGNDLMIYSEAYSLDAIYDLEIELLLPSEEDKEEFKDIISMVEKTIGLSVKEDILSWMDKGYAMVIQRNDNNLVPAISIYVDASSNKEDAEQVVEVLDAAFSQAVLTALAQAPEDMPADEILKKDDVKVGNATLHRVQVDLTDLSEEELLAAGLPSGMFEQPIELYYGLLDNDYFVLSTYTGLADAYENTVTVEKNPLVIEAMGHVKDYPYGLSYISVPTTMLYVDNFLAKMELVNGPMPDKVREGYTTLKKYLAPLDYLVAGNKDEDALANGVMFIKIQQPAIPEVVKDEEEAEDASVIIDSIQ